MVDVRRDRIMKERKSLPQQVTRSKCSEGMINAEWLSRRMIGHTFEKNIIVTDLGNRDFLHRKLKGLQCTCDVCMYE